MIFFSKTKKSYCFLVKTDVLIFPLKLFKKSEKLINELHAWIENHPHVIHYPNVKDSAFVKINGTMVRKQNHLPQISVREIQNGMILPSYEGSFSGAIAIDGNICIGDMSLRKYMPKYIEPISNINKITCGCKTCISAMIFQSDLNKYRISKWSKLDKLYINSASTRLLERSNDRLFLLSYHFIDSLHSIFIGTTISPSKKVLFVFKERNYLLFFLAIRTAVLWLNEHE